MKNFGTIEHLLADITAEFASWMAVTHNQAPTAVEYRVLALSGLLDIDKKEPRRSLMNR